jgi:RNA polymerase sigma-70 factor, ECF subfamily
MPAMEAADDRALLARTASGDARAFETFVRRWEGPLFRFLRRTTGSETLAEEARQLTFIRVYTRAGQHRGGSVPVWLFRTAYRVARNADRRVARSRSAPLAHGDEIPDPAASPDARLLEAEEQAALRQSLKKLAPRDRALLWLRVGEGLSLEETARVLRAPASTLRYRFVQALARLRRELASPCALGDTDGLQ